MVDNAFINTDLLKDFRGEVFVIHGDKDSIIPLKLGQTLYEHLDTSNKEMVIIQGAGHNDIFNFFKTYEAISKFLDDKK